MCTLTAPRSHCSSRAHKGIDHARHHERQRLEPLDRPLEHERRLERLVALVAHQRTQVLAARQPLPARPDRAHTRQHVGRGQACKLPERGDAPANQRGHQRLGLGRRRVRGRQHAVGWHRCHPEVAPAGRRARRRLHAHRRRAAAVERRQQADRQRRQRLHLAPVGDHVHAIGREGHGHRHRACRGHAHGAAPSTPLHRIVHLLRQRMASAEQPPHAAAIEHDQVGRERLDTWRVVAGEIAHGERSRGRARGACRRYGRHLVRRRRARPPHAHEQWVAARDNGGR